MNKLTHEIWGLLEPRVLSLWQGNFEAAIISFTVNQSVSNGSIILKMRKINYFLRVLLCLFLLSP